jgi:hypothetical protein
LYNYRMICCEVAVNGGRGKNRVSRNLSNLLQPSQVDNVRIGRVHES